MHWTFLTTVRFQNSDGDVVRLEYAVAANDTADATKELSRRFMDHEVFGYTIENIVAASDTEVASLNLPAGCVMLLAQACRQRLSQVIKGRTMHFGDDDLSPVSETLLFRLYDANRSGLPLPIAEIPAHLRPTVALYCYRRGHLEDTAVRIAATCDEEDLVFAGGRAGSALFSKSRLPHQSTLSEQRTPRSKITLAVLQVVPMVQFDQDADDGIN